jgi:adenosyl cobinamide kinase/adenosyl cobinamide phosphate guanylyltransferase
MTLLLGGARSGKSALAVRLALAGGSDVTMIATGEAGDDEMQARIAAHRAERPAGWATIEAPRELEAALAVPSGEGTVVLDCLTLWVANLLEAGTDDGELLRRAERAAVRASARPGFTVVVSNDVGAGIVPVNALARRYRDLLGAVNAVFAAHAARALYVVAGRVLELRDPLEPVLDPPVLGATALTIELDR